MVELSPNSGQWVSPTHVLRISPGNLIPAVTTWFTPEPRTAVAGLSASRFFLGLPLRRSGHPACGTRLVRRGAQYDEVGNLPGKGWLLASLGLAPVSFLKLLRRRSSISLAPVPRDDNGELRRLSSESLKAPFAGVILQSPRLRPWSLGALLSAQARRDDRDHKCPKCYWVSS